MIQFITYWKEIALCVLLFLFLSTSAAIKFQSDQINLLETSLKTCSDDKEDLTLKVAAVEQAARDADKAFKESEVKRQEIVTILTEQVNKIKNQNVPKECKAAVQWAKDNKGDLSWSKK